MFVLELFYYLLYSERLFTTPIRSYSRKLMHLHVGYIGILYFLFLYVYPRPTFFTVKTLRLPYLYRLMSRKSQEYQKIYYSFSLLQNNRLHILYYAYDKVRMWRGGYLVHVLYTHIVILTKE